MRKIKVHFPIGASAEFEFTAPDNWDKLSHKKKFEYAMDANDLHANGYLCHQCNRHLETDFEVATTLADPKYTTFFEGDEK